MTTYRVAIFVISLAVLLVACGKAQPPRSTTVLDRVSELFTVVHDEHLFVIYRGYGQGGLVHHPSCPCLLGVDQ